MLLVLSLALGCGAMETRVPVSQEAIRVAKVESTADGIQRAYQDYA
jgi:hypothetical protein